MDTHKSLAIVSTAFCVSSDSMAEGDADLPPAHPNKSKKREQGVVCKP